MIRKIVVWQRGYSVGILRAAESGTLTDILTRNIISQKVLMFITYCKNQTDDMLNIQNIIFLEKLQCFLG